jgi:methylmalonyl-CoA mutase C-terminal domain/subunit
LTKPTQDGHDRGVRFLARCMRDAGFEVVFTNFLLAEEVVRAAIQEDVDVIGVSSSSGGHMAVFEDLMAGLASAGASDILVIGGGVIPDDDVKPLTALGVSAVFGPGSSAEAVIDFVRAQR